MKKWIYCTVAIFVSFTWNSAFSGAQSAPEDKTANDATAQQEAPPKAARADDTFVIGSDDVLSIGVWKEADLTKIVPVRTDGKITLPLIGEVTAAGRTPLQLQEEITGKLKGYITDPQVSVIVQEIRSLKFNILGQVNKPGTYQLSTGMTIVDAIAVAGGFRDFAKKKGIYILRQGGTDADNRINFNYQDFIKGKTKQPNVALKSRDTIVVP